jgi:hypothetical protein
MRRKEIGELGGRKNLLSLSKFYICQSPIYKIIYLPSYGDATRRPVKII